MLSFTVRMRFEQDDIEKVAELLGPLTAASRKEPGCVSYIPHFVEDDPSTVLIYEQYADEAALDKPPRNTALPPVRHRRPLPADERSPARKPDGDLLTRFEQFLRPTHG